MAGSSFQSFGRAIALARYVPNGSLDPTFAGDGTRLLRFVPGNVGDGPVALGRQLDGKLLVAGTADVGDPVRRVFVISRLRPTGRLDRSFGDEGEVRVRFPDVSVPREILVQPDGKIVMGGVAADYEFAFVRLLRDGSPDTSFSGDGKRLLRLSETSPGTGLRDLALQPDGRLVAVGSGRGQRDWLVMRLRRNGSLDPSFSRDGVRRTVFGDPDRIQFPQAVTLQPDGRILAGGKVVQPGEGPDPVALVRYLPNGRLDDSFAGNGKRTAVFDPFADGHNLMGLAVQPDAKIVAVGQTYSSFGRDSWEDLALARFKPDGSFDRGFGEGGVVNERFGGDSRANAVALQSDGKIVVTGHVQFDMAVMRYLAR